MWGLLWSSDLFYHKCAIFFQNKLWECHFEKKDSLAKKNCYLGKMQKKNFLLLENGQEVFCSEALQSGRDYIVQVIKEEREDKLAEVSTKIEIKGKYLVYFPQETKLRISKKIEAIEERTRLEEIFLKKEVEGNFLIRTEALGIEEDVLWKEAKSLTHIWQEMKNKAYQKREKTALYEPQIWIENILEKYGKEEWEFSYEDDFDLGEVLAESLSRYEKSSRAYLAHSLWKEKQIDEHLEKICFERVELEGGAYLFFERTKALISIDVNSGSQDIEKTNELAAYEIPKQLRLRNWSGIVVVDFINSKQSKQRLLHILKQGFGKENLEIRFSGFQEFGLCIFTKERKGMEIEYYFDKKSLFYQAQALENEIFFLLEKGETDFSIFGDKEVLRLWKEKSTYRKRKEIKRIEAREENGYRIEL